MDAGQAKGKQEQVQVASSKLNTSERFEAKEKAGKLVLKKQKKVNERADFWLKPEDVERIISAAASFRDRCIIKLLYFAMMRRDEVRSLEIPCVDFANRRLNLTHTKGNKPRSIPIVQEGLLDDLRLVIEDDRKAGWVFRSKVKDGRLSLKAINDIVGGAARRAGVASPVPGMKNVHPHILRHSYARFLRRQQPPIAIEVLQKLLGHTSVKTTLDIYARADLDFMETELKRCSTSKAL